MTGKKIALIFFIMLGVGVALVASVWRLNGTLGFVVGIIGMLVIIGAIKWLESMVNQHYEEKRAAKKREENEYRITNLDIPVEKFEFKQNPELRTKLKWWFGGLTVIGFSTLLGGKILPLSLLLTGFLIGFWSVFMLAAVCGKANEENKANDFSYMWGAKPSFRRNNLLLLVIMWAVVFGIGMAAPPPPKAGPYIIALFSTLMVMLIIQMIYIKYVLEKDVTTRWIGWSSGEKRMNHILNGLTLVLAVGGYPLLSVFLPGYIYELYFCLLFAATGLLVGYFVHDVLKNKFTEFFNDDERKSEILLQIYIGSLILLLCVATIVNYSTAKHQTEWRTYKVTNRSVDYKGKNFLWLEIDGHQKRFEPKVNEMKATMSSDSIPVLVGKGILGFNCILQFGSPEK